MTVLPLLNVSTVVHMWSLLRLSHIQTHRPRPNNRNRLCVDCVYMHHMLWNCKGGIGSVVNPLRSSRLYSNTGLCATVHSTERWQHCSPRTPETPMHAQANANASREPSTHERTWQDVRRRSVGVLTGDHRVPGRQYAHSVTLRSCLHPKRCQGLPASCMLCMPTLHW